MTDKNVQQQAQAAHALYERNFRQHGATLDALMYAGGSASQRYRFDAILGIGDLSGKSILDVGCGYADLHPLVKERYRNAVYTGLEPVAGFAQAARERHPEAEVIVGTIESLPPGRAWDYVLECGIYNIACYDFSYLKDSLEKLFARARVGVSENFLSCYSTGVFNATASYFNPADIVPLAASLSRKFTLRHDYRTNDFTLYLWRDDHFPGTRDVPGQIDPAGIRSR